MKILVTGANGMLGSDICSFAAERGHDIYASDLIYDRRDKSGLNRYLDITDFSSVRSLMRDIKPDMVMHLAAETDVDKCELERSHAYRVNAGATQNIARVCNKLGAILVYTSTAAIFDGKKKSAYIESDKPRPRGVYARSKFKGEEAVRGLVEKHFIARAGWMIGGIDRDKKFVAKILKILETKNVINVVNDKFGSPTFTKDFARCLTRLVETDKYGTYHMANKGRCSRYDMAKKIVECLGRKDIKINPVDSDMFPFPAARGRSEILENQQLEHLGMNTMRPWEEAIKEYVLEWKRKKEL